MVPNPVLLIVSLSKNSKKFLDSLWSKVEIISGSTATEIDDRLSPGNVTRLSGETALLACKIYNLGNKSVSKQ